MKLCYSFEVVSVVLLTRFSVVLLYIIRQLSRFYRLSVSVLFVLLDMYKLKLKSMCPVNIFVVKTFHFTYKLPYMLLACAVTG